MIRRATYSFLRYGLPMLAMSLAACDSGTTAPVDDAVASVAITSPSTTVAVGNTLQLSVTVLPANATQSVTWSTDNVSRASVSNNGLVTALAPGAVSITATSTANPARSATVQLTVTGCTTLANADVVNGATLPANSCYQVPGPLTVSGGALSIQAGVRIAFGANGSLTIADGGSMNAFGQEANPIVFTGTTITTMWRGVHFSGSQHAGNVMRYTRIENAGSTGWSGAPYSRAALLLSDNARLDIQDCTISGSGGQGINVYGGSQLIFENNTLQNNAVAAWVHPNLAGAIGRGTQFINNTENVVRVSFNNTETVSTAQTWLSLAVPYELQTRLFIEAALTLEAGTDISAIEDAEIVVNSGGSLKAVGTVAAPIVFTSAEALPGSWRGIQINSASSNNIFDHVFFENGGRTAWTGNPDSRAMVYLSANSKAVFTNSTFRGSTHYGLWVTEGADISGFDGNTFSANTRGLIVDPNQAGAISANNTFVGNTENKVRVSFANTNAVTSAQTWKDFGVPFYVMVRTNIDAPLTIAAGTEVEFAQDASFVVDDGGSLRVSGSAQAPVALRGAQDFNGYWQGIQFNTLSAGNAMTHTTISNAGSVQWFGGQNSTAAVHVTSDGSLALDNVTVQKAGGFALIMSLGAAVTCANFDAGGAMVYRYTGVGTGVAQVTCP